jgi:hypothetical protein
MATDEPTDTSPTLSDAELQQQIHVLRGELHAVIQAAYANDVSPRAMLAAVAMFTAGVIFTIVPTSAKTRPAFVTRMADVLSYIRRDALKAFDDYQASQERKYW